MPVIIHGASPKGGADGLVEQEAYALGIGAVSFPILPAKDGHGRPAPIRRNERMIAEGHPNVGAAFVVGRVGEAVGTNGHYLSNGTDYTVNRLRALGKAVVVYREDGVEPCRDLGMAKAMLGDLWRAGLYRDDVARAGVAVRDACGGGQDALIAARAGVEALRVARPVLAPWLAPVEMALAL